jgi:hypothetical protein
LKTKLEQEKEAILEAEKMQGLGKILKKTGRRTSSGKALGRQQGPKSKPKSSANKAPRKLQSGILGQYGKVNKVCFENSIITIGKNYNCIFSLAEQNQIHQQEKVTPSRTAVFFE